MIETTAWLLSHTTKCNTHNLMNRKFAKEWTQMQTPRRRGNYLQELLFDSRVCEPDQKWLWGVVSGAEKGAGSQRGSWRETERQKGSCNRQRQSYCMDNEQSTQSLLLVSLFCLLPGPGFEIQIQIGPKQVKLNMPMEDQAEVSMPHFNRGKDIFNE